MKKVTIFLILFLALAGCSNNTPNKNINNETLTKENVTATNSEISSVSSISSVPSVSSTTGKEQTLERIKDGKSILKKTESKSKTESKNKTVQSSVSQIKPVTDDDLQLAKYKLDMSIDKFIKVMPKNLKKKTSKYNDSIEIIEKTFEFEDGTIFFFTNDSLYSISTQNPEYYTPRNLKVGDSISTLSKLYGNPHYKTPEGCWQYTYEGGEDYIVFTVIVSNDKVSKIKMSLIM